MPALNVDEKGFQVEYRECGAMEMWWVIFWCCLQSERKVARLCINCITCEGKPVNGGESRDFVEEGTT